jgi:hypothetical protein
MSNDAPQALLDMCRRYVGEVACRRITEKVVEVVVKKHLEYTKETLDGAAVTFVISWLFNHETLQLSFPNSHAVVTLIGEGVPALIMKFDNVGNLENAYMYTAELFGLMNAYDRSMLSQVKRILVH